MEYVYKLTGCYNQCRFRRFLTTDVEHSNRCAMAAIEPPSIRRRLISFQYISKRFPLKETPDSRKYKATVLA